MQPITTPRLSVITCFYEPANHIGTNSQLPNQAWFRPAMRADIIVMKDPGPLNSHLQLLQADPGCLRAIRLSLNRRGCHSKPPQQPLNPFHETFHGMISLVPCISSDQGRGLRTITLDERHGPLIGITAPDQCEIPCLNAGSASCTQPAVE
jgi:hypothetical protein